MKILKIVNGKTVSEPRIFKKDSNREKINVNEIIKEIENDFLHGKIIVGLAVVKVHYWDPKTEPGRLALIDHLDTKLHTTEYTTLFPVELTTAVLSNLHKMNLMANYICTGSNNAVSDQKKFNSYKHNLLDGPNGTDMTTIPVPTDDGAAPLVVEANIMENIGLLRDSLMLNPNWNDTVAKDLWLYGTDGEAFDKELYVAKYSAHPFPGYIHIHVGTKHVHVHNAYIRKAGTTVWDAPIRFEGANFDLHRVPTTSPENLEVMLKGVIGNVETPILSVITKITFTADLT